MPVYTRLNGVSHWGHALPSEQLEANLQGFLQWGLLGVGAFSNVRIPSSGVYGGDFSRFRPVIDPSYANGRVWEAARKDFVWESGIDYGYQPIGISGVFFNGAFLPLGSGYHVNYPQGRIVFDEAKSLTGTLRAEYSYRNVHVTTAKAPWFRELQYDSFRVDSGDYLAGSGAWSKLASQRVQLPAVVVEAVPRVSLRGGEIGGNALLKQDFLFHILAENPWDRQKLHDLLVVQWNKTLYSFDVNRLVEEDKFPLNYRGAPRTGALTYPDLVRPSGDGGYFWKNVTVSQVSSAEREGPAMLYQATVRWTVDTTHIFGT